VDDHETRQMDGVDAAEQADEAAGPAAEASQCHRKAGEARRARSLSAGRTVGQTDVSGMGRPPTFWSIAAGIVLLAGCDGASQFVHPSAYPADEARGCLGAPKGVADVFACTGQPVRAVRIICLVDSGGQLYLATVNEAASVWGKEGTSWRFSDAEGTDLDLTAAEEMRCSDFTSRVGVPEPAKQCSP
jgi:hypothetical protein